MYPNQSSHAISILQENLLIKNNNHESQNNRGIQLHNNYNKICNRNSRIEYGKTKLVSCHILSIIHIMLDQNCFHG